MNVPAVEGVPTVGTVARIVLRRRACRRAEFFYYANIARAL